jgi:hypothetical protein
LCLPPNKRLSDVVVAVVTKLDEIVDVGKSVNSSTREVPWYTWIFSGSLTVGTGEERSLDEEPISEDELDELDG